MTLQDIANQINSLLEYAIIFALAVTGIVCIVEFMRRPWFMVRKVDRIAHQAGIKNSANEYVTLRSIRKNPNKRHEKILSIYCPGLSLADMDEHRHRWEAGLRGQIRMEYGKKAGIILLYFCPQKFVKPTIISISDNAFGPISVQGLINLAIVGATGTGKSTLTKILMYKIAKFTTGTLWIIDPKQYDFQNFANLPHYYGYETCAQGINDYYSAFVEQKRLGRAGNPQYLFIDEWAALLLSHERKEAEQLKAKIAELLMTGRSYNYVVICCQQRAAAELFPSGSRDQFRAVLALGNLSKEQKQMLFHDYKDRMTENNGLGEGFLLVDGYGDIERVKVEQIKDWEILNAAIREAMNR